MPLLHLESLPPRVRKGDLLKLLVEVGGLNRRQVGRIELLADRATVEVPAGWEHRLAKSLGAAELSGRTISVWAETDQTGAAGGDDHFQRLLRLLELEVQSEALQAAERARRLTGKAAERTGASLLDLQIIEEESGLGGRLLITLAKPGRAVLPWNRLGVGAPVMLTPASEKPGEGLRGVVFQQQDHTIGVALAGVPEEWGDAESWRLDLSNNDVAAGRLRLALQRAAAARGDRLAELRAVLLGDRAPQFVKPTDEPLLNAGLNEVQRQAVQFALSSVDFALLHGPPGTGKTTTVVELIRRAVARGEKVLACAPSNLGVDNLLEKLLAAGVQVVRLGHPARVMPQLRANCTFDLLVNDHADVRLARKLVKEALALFRKASRWSRARPAPGERQEIRDQAKGLLADARRLESQAVEQILNAADVICATTTGLSSDLLGGRRFDLAVIDEACQSTEPGCWLPLLWSERLVLAGDHCQLPPTVVDKEAERQGFGVSMFERLLERFGAGVSRRLTVQYRMHEAIMGFSSGEFYDGELTADDSVRRHLLTDLAGVQAVDPLTETPLEFIDTAGASFDEELEPDGESRCNPREAKLVGRKVQQLIDAGLQPQAIAVIAPYSAQVRLLRELLTAPGLEIDSVDGFQGREKDAVVISMVRSNAAGEIGFLQETRRTNVALTRARRKLLVIGDSATLARHPFYAALIEYFESRGGYRSVWEEPDAV